MALDIAMKIVFAGKLGTPPGDSTKDKRKGLFDVIAFEQEGNSPRDPATGQATGKRHYKPVKTTIIYQAAVPDLWEALARNESAKEVKIDFYSPNQLGKMGGVGAETLHYTITLKDAFISRIQHGMLNNRILASHERADNKYVENHIAIEWVFGHIIWEWKAGTAKMREDAWTKIV